MQQVQQTKPFIIGSVLSAATGLCLVIISLAIGKKELFLFFNTDLGNFGDHFFALWTNLGDGIVWVVVAVLFFIYRKKLFPLLIASVIISTLIVQLTKNFVFPGEARPTSAITNNTGIHTVPGVELLTSFSFPSGHTTTAFTIFLLGCLLIKKNWVIPVGFICALLVGYSRIYLAEHFPLDVGAGMLAAVITVPLSIMIQNRWARNQPSKSSA